MAGPAGRACCGACADSCRSCAMRDGRDPLPHGVPARMKTAVVFGRRIARHHGLRRAHGADACVFWPASRRHPLLGVAPPGWTCLPGWLPQNERSGGHGCAYASHAGRIYPSCALLPTPRLPAALGRCRGHSRIFSTAPRKALGDAAGARSIFVGQRIPAGWVFAKFFLNRANLAARGTALRRPGAPGHQPQVAACDRSAHGRSA